MPNGFPLRRALAAAAAAAALAAGLWLAARREPAPLLAAASPEALHFDLVELTLRAEGPRWRERLSRGPLRAEVRRAGAAVETVGGLRQVPLLPAGPGLWRARWPVPWNAPEGEYAPALLGAGEEAESVRVSAFRVARRAPAPQPQGLVAATWEAAGPVASLRARGPDGRLGDWRVLLDWAKWLGADAVWFLAGRSPGEGPGEVWERENLALVPEIARECRARGLRLGVYALYSLTDGGRPALDRYEYGIEVAGGRPRTTRAISLRDPKRAADAAALLASLAALPGVDFVGLDYIRNALGGAELVDDFTAEMPGLALPPEWPRLSREERMVWLSRKSAMRRDAAFTDAWQWWRARQAALRVREVKAALPAKPLWVFTLTWDKGWHHGQDPVMMTDAGADLDALMFYEADAEQFEAMLKDWSAYLPRGQVQVLAGNIVDWRMHQRDPAGPAEFSRRLLAAYGSAQAGGPARGIFIHDLSRLARGRLGPWGARGWAEEARRAARAVKGDKT